MTTQETQPIAIPLWHETQEYKDYLADMLAMFVEEIR